MTTVTDDIKAKQEAIRALTEARNERFKRAEEETIAEIMVSPDMDESEKQALKKKLLFIQEPVSVPTLIGIRREMPASIAQGQEIFGSDFISHFALQKTEIGKRVNIPYLIPESKLPFSVMMLEEAAAAGCMLVYQPEGAKGKPIDLDSFAMLVKGMEAKGGGKLLYGDQFDLAQGTISPKAWFADKKYSEYRNQQVIRPNVFRLAKKSEISGTPNQRFMAQVLMQCDWIEKSFPQSVTEVMKAVIAEVRKDAKRLEEIQNNDSAEFLKQIVNYKFFTLFMETGLETLFRMVAYNQVTGEKLLQGMYLRNGVTEPVYAYLGRSGLWDEDGPRLGGYVAWDTDSRLGMGFSCIGV